LAHQRGTAQVYARRGTVLVATVDTQRSVVKAENYQPGLSSPDPVAYARRCRPLQASGRHGHFAAALGRDRRPRCSQVPKVTRIVIICQA